MRQHIYKKITPSEELAYWVGVMHSDGCLRNSKTHRNHVYVGVRNLSFPMLEKFAKISQDIFGIKSNIRIKSKTEPCAKSIEFSERFHETVDGFRHNIF